MPVVITRFHGLAADVAQLRHAAAIDNEPLGADALVLSARSLGMKARVVPLRTERLNRLPVPALALDRDGKHFVIAACDGKTAFVLESDASAPVVVPINAIAVRWTGHAIAFASRASLAGELVRFDFS